MKEMKFVIKGVILWMTLFAVILYISGIDSIIDNGYFIVSTLSIAIMCFACYKLISVEELETLLLYKWYKEIFERK